jgi:hypothetical protein
LATKTRSQKRQNAMGNVDAFNMQQQGQAAQSQQPPSATDTSVPHPEGEAQPVKETPEQKSERQKKLAEAIAAREAEEERKRQISDLQKSAEQTVRSASGILRNSRLTLEKIPQPGSIALPLLILIVLLMAIVVVNGHTRIVWLWNVVTGNAAIQVTHGASGTFSATPPISSSSASIPQTTPLSVPIVAPDIAHNGVYVFGTFPLNETSL